MRRHHRPGRQSVGARAIGRRVRWRVERGARIPAGARSHGDRHGWLAAHPLGRVRDIDDQANSRFRLDAGDRAACMDFRPSRADDPDPRATPNSCSKGWPVWPRRPRGGRSAATPSPHASRFSSRMSPTGSIERSRRYPASASSRRLRRHGSTSLPTSSISSSPRCSSTTVASTTGATGIAPRIGGVSSTPSRGR